MIQLIRWPSLAGNRTHWTNESTLKLWVDKIVNTEHKKRCEERGLDPGIAKSIVNIDCYPVHISREFRAWMKRKYKMHLLVYVPLKCTSKAQFADVVLNNPFKNYYSRSHTMYLMNKVKEHQANNEELSTFNFNMLVTAVSAPALQWLEGYDKLGELDHQPGLRNWLYQVLEI